LHEKFAKPFPHFNTVVLSQIPAASIDNEVSEKHLDILEIVGKVFEFANQNFESGKISEDHLQVLKLTLLVHH
jgi:hypothetical protein